jgi:hypothetical protein
VVCVPVAWSSVEVVCSPCFRCGARSPSREIVATGVVWHPTSTTMAAASNTVAM